jgi:tetratricopeptide (TPR) repeat protein
MEKNNNKSFEEKEINNLEMLLKSSKFDESKIQSEKLIKIYPKNFKLYNYYAISLAVKGEVDNAIKNFKQAINLKPNFIDAYFNLANTFKDINKDNEAIENYKKAVELKPDYAEAHGNLGIVLKKINRLDEAINSLQKAVSCNSNYFGAYYIMGIILFEKNELNLAKAAFENVIKIKPNFKEVYSSLGKVYLAQGEHANGLKMIAKANGFIRFTSTSKINIIN